MIHLGDITKIRGCTAPIVDCVIGGSPCQDLSIAGKRAGFSGERSVLFLEEIRITKEMRYRDRANGRTGQFIRPRYLVWENVPGAFSSNGGRDFQTVLTEIVRVVEPEAPPSSFASKRLVYKRLPRGRRMERCLASTRRKVLGSAPASPQNRACRRFWRTIRTRNIICPQKPVREF